MRTTDHADTENLHVTEVKSQSTDRPTTVSDVTGDNVVTEIHEACVFEQRLTALLGRSSKVDMKPNAHDKPVTTKRTPELASASSAAENVEFQLSGSGRR